MMEAYNNVNELKVLVFPGLVVERLSSSSSSCVCFSFFLFLCLKSQKKATPPAFERFV